jgi:hypothetical protein
VTAGPGADIRALNKGFGTFVETTKTGRAPDAPKRCFAWGKGLSIERICQIGAPPETVVTERANRREPAS